MKPLDKNAVNELNKQFNFYDFNAFRSGNDLRIVFTEAFGAVRFGDLDYGAKLEEYRIRENLLCELALRIVSRFSDRELILKKYEDPWIVNKEFSQELYEELRKRRVDNNVSAISLDKTSPWIRSFMEATLKYNSFFEFVFPLEKVALTVTDHMDIFISAEKAETLQWIENVVEEANREEKIFTVIKL